MFIDAAPPPTRDVKFEADEEGEWEDIPDADLTRQGSDHVGTGVSMTSRTPMRRRKVVKPTFVAQPQKPFTSRRLASPPKAQRKPLVDINSDQVQDALAHGAAASVRYFGSVITDALRYLRRPLGFLVFLWLLAFVVGKVFHAAIAPVCWMPVISSWSLCKPSTAFTDAPQRADFPRLVQIQSSNFDDLLSNTVSGSALSLDIKNAEMATKDLVTLVKVSDLKSRELLATSLNEFGEKAKKAGKGLNRLNSRINGAVDNIMGVNDHALHTIEEAKEQPNSLLRVIWPFGASDNPNSQEKIIESFRRSMEVHATEMQRLVLEVEVALANLDALDEHLSVLHELCARENLTLDAAHADLLSGLWTKLGGNRARLRKFSTNLELLKSLGEYRKRARAHVAAAMQTLEAMGEDMEDLRERVTAPEIVGDKIPVEVHMKSIQSGMERLKEQRIKAREREEQLMNRILGIED